MAVIVTVDNHPNGTIPSERRINLDYFKTPPGIVKIAQFVLGVILLCVTKIPKPFLTLECFGILLHLRCYVCIRHHYLLTLFFIAWHLPALIFGVFNTVAYAIGSFLLMKDWKDYRSQQNVGMQGP
ncbi:hypothetical protein Ocin01_12303 [Orchesella cincta]|uniref:Uncharacterized protein n=1 Tax=Orchesella cincta TaxID=48709 RepID=A0A1D2MN63_ORCCI|nr:hypothetical protein Ocin01_12303 [Orchesella cincta]